MPAKIQKPYHPDHLIHVGIITYLVALALIAAFTLAFHFLADSIVRRQQTTAAVVNVSGRQRMLSQRIAKLALERAAHANFRPDSQVQSILLKSIDQMATAHQALLHGSPELHLLGPSSQAVRDVYTGAPWYLDLQIENFLTHARAFANRPTAQITLSDPDLVALEQAAQTPLLDALNAAVDANQQTSESAILRLREILTILTLLMLLILVLEALFLYRPLFRHLAQAHFELIEAGRTDPLTGCLNRRAFTHEAHAAVSRARNHGRPLAVLMLDIDRFKDVNDRYGHNVGDSVITAVVRTLLLSVHTNDILCRMGGEEFAIMLPGKRLGEAITTADNVRQAVARTPIPLDEAAGIFLNVTASIGVAMLEDSDLSLFDVLGRADKALYRAKAGGRNRVETESGPYSPAEIEAMYLLRDIPI